jgi:hypothetical protein
MFGAALPNIQQIATVCMDFICTGFRLGQNTYAGLVNNFWQWVAQDLTQRILKQVCFTRI